MNDCTDAAQADADTLRDAGAILRRRALNPALIPPEMTYLAVTAAGLEREADRILEEAADE